MFVNLNMERSRSFLQEIIVKKGDKLYSIVAFNLIKNRGRGVAGFFFNVDFLWRKGFGYRLRLSMGPWQSLAKGPVGS